MIEELRRALRAYPAGVGERRVRVAVGRMCRETDMKDVRSALSAGHIVVLVEDVQRSAAFYDRIGLPAFMATESIAIIELRGGTHLLLAAPGTDDSAGMVSSRYGQMAPATGETLDLMIEGNRRKDLEAYRKRLIDKGVEAGDIADEEYFGHYFFSVRDPDDNVITVYTSHEIKYW